MITRTVQAEASDPKGGMTLAELADFVAEAQRAEVPGGSRVHVRVNMRGGIRRAETKP